MVTDKQNVIISISDEMQTFPMKKVLAVRDFVITLKREDAKATNAEKSNADEMAEFEADMDRCQQWAKDVGLTPDDITRVIKEVRMEKRQKA